MKEKFNHILFCCVTVTLFTGTLLAVPKLMRFQGRLTDSQGRPISGTPQVSFEIYDSPTGGARLWGPSSFQNVNANDAGLFTADIGPFISPSIFTGSGDVYLQVTIKSGTERANQILAPRQRLENVPYSFHSGHADQSDQATLANSVSDNSISASKIQEGAVGSSQIIDHSVDQVDLSTTIAAQFLPAGMISMFARACPAGWTRFDPLDNRFPLGAPAFTGDPGGSNVITGLTTNTTGAHIHQSPAHSHNAGTLAATPLTTRAGYQSAGGLWTVKDNPTVEGKTAEATVQIQSAGDHAHTVSSDGSWSPPYLGIVYCEKD